MTTWMIIVVILCIPLVISFWYGVLMFIGKALGIRK